MWFEWDDVKNRENQRKHGISFDLAARIFADRYCLVYPERVDEKTGEQRWHALGTIPLDHRVAILVVVHVYRKDSHEEEIIRIISARSAQKSEQRRYQQQTVDN